MKPHESPRINKKSIRGDSGDSWPVWNRVIRRVPFDHVRKSCPTIDLSHDAGGENISILHLSPG